MIFNMSGGGSADLNFKVVGGTTAPASPKENTIWVNTDTAIKEWMFASTNPFLTDENMLENTTVKNGYFNDSGVITSATSTEKEKYIEEYLPVEYGKEYKYEHTLSSSNSMWFAIVEYTGSYTFKQRLVVVNHVSGTRADGIYTPSSDSVTSIRISWSSYGDTSAIVNFYKHNITYDDSLGKVWFCIDTSSPMQFNALKKNEFIVYPLIARQYVSGAWVNKEAKSYQDGAWVGFAHLYDNGMFATEFDQYIFSTGTITKNADHIVLSRTTETDSQIGLWTTKKINLSQCKKICVEVSCSNVGAYNQYGDWRFRFGAFSNKFTGAAQSASNMVAGTIFTANGVKTVYEVDVSSLTGIYYVGIQGTGIAQVYKIWME